MNNKNNNILILLSSLLNNYINNYYKHNKFFNKHPLIQKILHKIYLKCHLLININLPLPKCNNNNCHLLLCKHIQYNNNNNHYMRMQLANLNKIYNSIVNNDLSHPNLLDQIKNKTLINKFYII